MTLQYARSFDANQNRIQIIEQIIEPHLFAGAGDSFGIDGLEEVDLCFVPRPELFSFFCCACAGAFRSPWRRHWRGH